MDGWFSNCRVDLKKIKLTQSQKKILLEHAKNEKPNEACAILFGNIMEQNIIVNDIFLTKNVEKSTVNFTISNEQLIEGYRLAEERKMDVVGIFHSHPESIARPSNTDKKFMYSNPVVWIIYSGISNEFRSFILEKEITEITTEFL